MCQYEVKFFEDGIEIDLDVLPIEYINGVIQLCRDEVISRERWERMCRRMVKTEGK